MTNYNKLVKEISKYDGYQETYIDEENEDYLYSSIEYYSDISIDEIEVFNY